MAKLRTSDLFKAARIIRKADIKNELRPLIEKAASGENVNAADIGIEAVLTIIEALSAEKAEAAIYDFLSAPMEKEPEEIEAMELDELAAALQRIAEENDLRNFFKVLAGLMNTKSLN